METLKWKENIPLEKWARVHDGGKCQRHMTTKMVEAMN